MTPPCRTRSKLSSAAARREWMRSSSSRAAAVFRKGTSMRNCSGIKLPAFLVLASLAAAQDDIDAVVARARQTFDVPGIAIAIVKDGRVVLQKGYGVRKLGDP